MDLIQFKNEIGYGPEWEVLIPESFFLAQLMAYQHEVQNGMIPDKQHFKWAAYRYIIDNHDLSSSENWSTFVSVIEADSDQHLFKGAISDLIDTGKITVSHLQNVKCEKLLNFYKVKQLLA